MDISRNFMALFLASFVSIVLFYSMHLLIKQDAPKLTLPPPLSQLDFLRVPEDTSDKPVIEPPKRPADVLEPPQKTSPIIDLPNSISDPTPHIITDPNGSDDVTPVGIDHNHITIVAVTPRYPPTLANKCIEGYVVTGFTVTKSGSVIDPYIISSSNKGFHSSALRAIKKFKFKPKVVNGSPVASPNAKYKLSYKLEGC